jgi:hypothetical protein
LREQSMPAPVEIARHNSFAAGYVRFSPET